MNQKRRRLARALLVLWALGMLLAMPVWAEVAKFESKSNHIAFTVPVGYLEVSEKTIDNNKDLFAKRGISKDLLKAQMESRNIIGSFMAQEENKDLYIRVSSSEESKRIHNLAEADAEYRETLRQSNVDASLKESNIFPESSEYVEKDGLMYLKSVYTDKNDPQDAVACTRYFTMVNGKNMMVELLGHNGIGVDDISNEMDAIMQFFTITEVMTAKEMQAATARQTIVSVIILLLSILAIAAILFWLVRSADKRAKRKAAAEKKYKSKSGKIID